VLQAARELLKVGSDELQGALGGVLTSAAEAG
jgi:hypothetical protein